MYVCLIFRFNISCSPLGGPHQRRTAPILRVENPENPKDADQDSLHSECTIDSGLESAYFPRRREPRSRHLTARKGDSRLPERASPQQLGRNPQDVPAGCNLLRSATVRKFMVGPELLGSRQRDIPVEAATATLSTIMQSTETDTMNVWSPAEPCSAGHRRQHRPGVSSHCLGMASATLCEISST